MASPTSTASPSPSTSPEHSRPSSQHGDSTVADSIPVETLVQHLLDAKRSLSTMTLVLRANDLVTAARLAHEESVILGAQSDFLRRGIQEQRQLLHRARRSMNRTYESGNREFKQIIKNLDSVNGRLEETMIVLRGRAVESAFRPKGEEKRDLLDFVDVVQVDTMRNALKENIVALQVSKQRTCRGTLARLTTTGYSGVLRWGPSPLRRRYPKTQEHPIVFSIISLAIRFQCRAACGTHPGIFGRELPPHGRASCLFNDTF